MSGRLQASGAGDRSSVLVSPLTLKTVRVRLSGTSGRLVNHSASAQLCKMARALALPLSALSLMSWKASNTSSVFLRSEEHTSELQSLMRISYAVFCLNKKKAANPSHKQHIHNQRSSKTNNNT